MYQPVNLDDLERFADGSVVDADALRAAGLITSALKPTKLLGEGKLTKKLTVKVQAASASALAAATKAGVTIELVPAIKVPSKNPPVQPKQLPFVTYLRREDQREHVISKTGL